MMADGLPARARPRVVPHARTDRRRSEEFKGGQDGNPFIDDVLTRDRRCRPGRGGIRSGHRGRAQRSGAAKRSGRSARPTAGTWSSPAPGGYAHYQNDGFFVAGRSDPKRDWPYVQPGPDDSWAGSRRHSFTIAFGIRARPAAAGTCTLQILCDHHPPHSFLNGHERHQRLAPAVAMPRSRAGSTRRSMLAGVPFPPCAQGGQERPDHDAVELVPLAASSRLATRAPGKWDSSGPPAPRVKALPGGSAPPAELHAPGLCRRWSSRIPTTARNPRFR